MDATTTTELLLSVWASNGTRTASSTIEPPTGKRTTEPFEGSEWPKTEIRNLPNKIKKSSAGGRKKKGVTEKPELVGGHTDNVEENKSDVIRIVGRETPGPFLKGLIGRRQVQMVIDTGACESVLSTEAADKCDCEDQEPPCPNLIMKTATGEECHIHRRVLIKITLQNQVIRQWCHVAEIEDNCILGMDFLVQNDCQILIRRKQMTVNNELFPVYFRSPDNDKIRSRFVRTQPEAPLKDTVLDLFQRSSQGLEPSQKQQLYELLKRFESVFASDILDMGRTNKVKHHIDVGGHAPIRQPPRRLPMGQAEEAERMVQEMYRQGVIEPSASPWSSPVVLVKKKDGSTRFCVDYRRLNAVTKKDAYPLPRIDEILDDLAGNEFFATLDLQSGYWQVEMAEEDREKTAFPIGRGLWQFVVLPFGLTGSPGTFERFMDGLLKRLPNEVGLVYLDDILVKGNTFADHLANLEAVFDCLLRENLKLSPKKCNLARTEVQYLGHKVTREGLHTASEKVEAVSSWPTPRTLTDVRSFLGLCQYYAKFVPNFSEIAKPLFQLTEGRRKPKTSSVLWTEECGDAFRKLKHCLTTAPVLGYPQSEGTFIVDTDCSHNSFGAVLSQIQGDKECVLEYFSKVLNKPERNYCATRQELLAVVKTIKHFRHYLLAKKFVVRTDHASLRWLMQFKTPEGQIARWIQQLQEYQFEVQYRPGPKHRNADAMSRRPCAATNCLQCRKNEQKLLSYGAMDEKSIEGSPSATGEMLQTHEGTTKESKRRKEVDNIVENIEKDPETMSKECNPATHLLPTRIEHVWDWKPPDVWTAPRFIYVKGDLLEAPKSFALAHCVAQDLRMSRGIAASFRERFGRISELKAQSKLVGQVARLQVNGQNLLYLITKSRNYRKPTYQSLWATLCYLRNILLANKINKLAIPLLGCGLDGLSWKKVRVLLSLALSGVPVEIRVYELPAPPRSVNVCTLGRRQKNPEPEENPLERSAEALERPLSEIQREDKLIQMVVQWKLENKLPSWQEVAHDAPFLKSLWSQGKLLELQGGLLYRRLGSDSIGGEVLQLVVPHTEIPRVLKEVHDSQTAGHFGLHKTAARIRQRWYWPGWREDSDMWVRNCETCIKRKGPRNKQKGLLQLYNVGAPMERVAVDVLGPFPVTDRGNKLVLVMVDYFTKWPEVVAIPNQEATTVAEALVNKFVTRFGVPLELHSDQGRNFESKVYQEMLRILGVHKTRTTAMHPSSNGMAERLNRTLLDFLAKNIDSGQSNWDTLLPLFLMAYRSAEHDTTQTTPAAMMLGRELRLPADLIHGIPPGAEVNPYGSYPILLKQKMWTVHDFVRTKVDDATRKYKTRYDTGRDPEDYGRGDAVWLYHPKKKKRRSPKLQSDWEGPYLIVERTSTVTYRIQRSARGRPLHVHKDRLALYTGRNTPSWTILAAEHPGLPLNDENDMDVTRGGPNDLQALFGIADDSMGVSCIRAPAEPNMP